MKHRKGIVIRSLVILCALSIMLIPQLALASGDDPLVVIDRFGGFLFSIVRAVGMISLLFALVSFAMSLKNHDSAARAASILAFAGGLIFTFAEQILKLITGGG
ncbi:glutamyl-tRNA amidotransferase [Eubacteriales bacterium OttesenSCG-928-N14]|nr:glutamyl-tRNA amidotransferase [Eubacteriales bacterium OttesenSCG-928-N14]